MGNILGCGTKKKKSKSNTNPYWRDLPHQIPRNEPIVRIPSARSTYSSAPVRVTVLPSVRVTSSSTKAAVQQPVRVLPSVRSTSRLPDNNRASGASPKQTPSNVVNSPSEQIKVALRTPSAQSSANTSISTKPITAAPQALPTLYTGPIDHPSYFTKILASALLNSVSSSEEDDEYNKFQSLSGGLTFTNTKYQTNADEENRKSKFILKQYWPGKETKIFFKKNFKNFHVCNSNGYHLIRLTSELKSNSNQLTEQNYLDALVIFADIEDLYCEEAIRVYNRKSEKIEQSTIKSRTYIIKVPNLIDSRPSISVCSRLMIKTNKLENFKPLHGTISEIAPNHIEVEFDDKIDTSIQYEVNFLSNRTTFRMEKLAIELMKQKNLVYFMFPKAKYYSSSVCPNKQQFSWFNKSVADNPEQIIIIESIYNGTSYPYPYIVFGPPGTGKTTTLVESILQLWKNKCDSKILVVATSNFACNVISKCLLQFLLKTEIFRLFSKTQEVLVEKIDADVLAASNLKGKYYSPQPSDLYPYRIIVATPTASGRLIQDRFDNNFFTHLFIDECGSCTEGSSLIPIAGLISSQNKINANIVLAGDPLQLRPVIFSKYAEDLGYGVSMIERLMEFPLYMVDEQIGDYNNKYITKLRVNYRSHKDILHISNQLFYKNELKAMGSKDVTDWIINWRHLPNPKFPIKFEAVFGECLSENGSPSLYNKHEIEVVMSHLNLLVNKNINGKMVRQSDIGVISPYRKQNQKIRAECDYRKWRDIEVASVEAFQGSEKSVIIFSTVRSNVDTMGFLNNERRLNVALTRAKGFLVIIGDPKVLMMDKCWYQLMKYCYDNNAICGEPFEFSDKV